MYVFIWWTDKTENIIQNSIIISNELQERIDSASFRLVWFSCNYFDDIKIWEAFPILSSTSNSVTIKKKYTDIQQNNIYRVWEYFTVAINLNDEEKWVISSISDNGWWTKITLSDNFVNTPISWELAGKKRFAGNIVDIQDKNNTILKNLEYSITALDYTRIFDKENLNDTYENKDARYIINDFCNTTINKNQAIDQFDYANTTELRTIWIESWDGWNPVLDTSDFRETTWCWVFDWTFSSGTASFIATLIAMDISSFTKVNSWTPISGRLGFWYKCSDFSDITNFKIRIGSDSSNYASYTITPVSNDWVFCDVLLSTWIITGTPNWQSLDYAAIIVTETWTSNLRIDGIRILENDFFRHYPYVQDTAIFSDFRMNRQKPIEVMQKIADYLSWYWDIDHDKYIRLFPNTETPAPISLNETSNNFANLSITYDTSRVINRQVVRWAEETSESTYTQVVEWNGSIREWITKNKFKNLTVKLNDGSSTDTCEVGTTTTTINATAHGLVAGDYIVNRTRSNAVRKILTATTDSFTVDAVTGQVSGDIFSLFVSKSVGVEWINEEASFNYMSNFNEKSIRATETEALLDIWHFLLFSYNEVIPILVQATDNASVTLMKSILWFTNGIFDGQPIVDRTIISRSEAIKTAEAVINKYSNVIITAKFTTEQEWLQAWQIIRIKDTTSSNRNIDQDFIIQNVQLRQIAWWENTYSVTCSSSLFGLLELLQQILANNRKIKVDEDEVINNIEDSNEMLILTDVVSSDIDGEINIETLVISDSITNDVVEPPFFWGDIGGGPTEFQWELSSWS